MNTEQDTEERTKAQRKKFAELLQFSTKESELRDALEEIQNLRISTRRRQMKDLEKELNNNVISRVQAARVVVIVTTTSPCSLHRKYHQW